MSKKIATLPPSITNHPDMISSQFNDGSVMRIYRLKGQPANTFTMDVVDASGKIIRAYEMVDTKGQP